MEAQKIVLGFFKHLFINVMAVVVVAVLLIYNLIRIDPKNDTRQD